jgi:hypothetical protein
MLCVWCMFLVCGFLSCVLCVAVLVVKVVSVAAAVALVVRLEAIFSLEIRADSYKVFVVI